MKLYEGTIEDFDQLVISNSISDLLVSNFANYYRRRPAQSEVRSWRESLNYLNNAFRNSELTDNHLVLEYELPFTSKRIDVIVFGSKQGAQHCVVIELKQWSNENVNDCSTEGNVIVDYGQFTKEQAHPSLQVEGYHYGLEDFVSVFTDEHEPVGLSSCVYCHNYSTAHASAVLYDNRFRTLLDNYPIFGKEDSVRLGNYLKERLSDGNGLEVFNRFINSQIRPSKMLLDHTGDMIHKQQMFTLIDDQIAAYNSIKQKVKQLDRTASKSVVIVKGGPGTGKSVIALEVMGELLRKGKTVFHATGSSAFTNTLRKIVGSRAKNLFKFFNSFSLTEQGTIDVLICDEAHRIRETSTNMYTPAAQRTDMPQIDELFNSAKLLVFFIDEFQVVRPNEIGSVQLIKQAAGRHGVALSDIAEFELTTQFRCSGSDAYLQWLDDVLDIRPNEVASYDPKMKFEIFDTPESMRAAVAAHNKEKNNSARLAAGFCWKWSDPNPDGTLVDDVVIGDFAMPWEKKNQFWKWATDDTGMDQVGTVYTAQGFEFDYIGVIFGDDLVYRQGAGWVAQPEKSKDSAAKRNNPELVLHLQHIYRVLLSRAHKGVYVYFMDKETEAYFRSRFLAKAEL